MVDTCAGRGARGEVSVAACVIDALHCTDRNTMGSEAIDCGGNVPNQPVGKIAADAVRVVHYQGLAFTASRQADNIQRRAYPLAFTGVGYRHSAAVFKGRAY